MFHINQKTHTTQDGTTIIVLAPTGRLDIRTALQFRVYLQECILNLSRHVVVNLQGVEFIDSSGLTSLVAGMRYADKVKGSFRLCHPLPEAKVVFESTMMDSVLEIYDDCLDCLENPNATPKIGSTKGSGRLLPDAEGKE